MINTEAVRTYSKWFLLPFIKSQGGNIEIKLGKLGGNVEHGGRKRILMSQNLFFFFNFSFIGV